MNNDPKYLARISIRFNSPDPDATADQIVRDLIDAGYDATLDDIEEESTR